MVELRGCARAHLDRYTDRNGPRAFWTYDRGDGGLELTPLDCLAPNLLSMRVDYRLVVPLFASEGDSSDLLAAMNSLLLMDGVSEARFLEQDLSADDGHWGAVRSVLRATEPVTGLSAVWATKVLHRKLPNLVPVYDGKVYEFYFGTKPSGRRAPGRFFSALHSDLLSSEPWLAELVSTYWTADRRPLSVLRAADIVIWEHCVGGCG